MTEYDIGTRRWWAAAALALSGVVIGIDGTVLNLALPTLSVDLHASNAQLQWFVDAYLLVLGALMLPFGMLGDRYGRKRLLLTAFAVFAVGSFACAYAQNPGQLMAARALLGLGAAAIMPLSFSVLPVMFAEHERQRAIAVVASAAMAAFPLGPLVGGWLLNHYWWGSVFLINIPVILLATAAVAAFVPESRGRQGRGLDLVGVVLSTAGLVAITYGIIEAGQDGWGDRRTVIGLLVGLPVLAGFGLWEWLLGRAGGQPLIDFTLFRSIRFTAGTVLSTLVSFALIGLLFAAPQYLRAVLGYDAMDAGIRLLPMIGGMIVGLAVGDRLVGRLGAKVTVAAGFAVMAAGLGLAATTAIGDGTGFMSTWIAIMGFGTGVVMPAAMDAALGQLTGERAGVGTALVAAIRQIGGVFGVAVLGSVLNSAYRDHLHLAGLPQQAADMVRDNVTAGTAVAASVRSSALLVDVQTAFVHGMDVLLTATAGVAVVAAVLALAFLPGRTRRSTASAPTPPEGSPRDTGTPSDAAHEKAVVR